MTKAVIELSAIDKTAAAFAAAKNNLTSLGQKAASLPLAFGTLGTAIAAAFTAVSVKGAIDTLDKLDDLSEKTGIAVEALGALRYAGEVTGTPLEAIATSTKKLAMNMAEAAAGNKEAASAFKAVGVEVKNADGSLRSQDAVLMDLADRFAGYEDGAGKAALAQKIFGKSGADMIPLLNQGSAGIRRLRGEAEALGVVYGGDLAKQAAQFNDNLKKLEMNAEAAKVQIAGGLLPLLNRMVETFIQLKGQGVVWTAMEEGLRRITTHVPVINGLMASLNVLRGGGPKLTGDAGADINSLMKQRERLQKDMAFAQGRGLPTRDMESQVARINDLLKVSRVYQANGAEYGGDVSDAMSRRAGGKTAAPGLPGDGKDKAASAAKKEAEERAKLLAELSGLTGSFAEDWARLNELYKSGAISLDQLTQSQGRLLEKQPFMEEKLRVEKELNDTREKAQALAEKSLGQLIAENEEIYKRNLTLGEEIEQIGLTAEQLHRLKLARMDANIVAQEALLIGAQNIEGNEKEVAAIERKINLLRQERELTGRHGDKQIAFDAKEKGDKESKEFSEGVQSDLKGAFQRAFEDSKNPGKAFAAAIASTLYTRVSSALADALANAAMSKSAGAGLGAIGKLFGFGGSDIAGVGDAGWGMDLGGMSFDGGGYTGNRPRSGGLDGKGGFMAMLHPQEDVIDRTKPGSKQGGAVPNITIVNQNTVGDVASMERVNEQLRVSERRTLAALRRSMGYGGELG